MLENIVDVLEVYHKKKEFADATFIEIVCNILNRHYELNDYIKCLGIYDKARGKNSRYSFVEGVLKFNLAKFYNKDLAKYLGDNYYGMYNLIVLKVIFHEIEHVKQEKIKDSQDDTIFKKILLLGDPLTYLKPYDLSDLSLLEKSQLFLKWRQYYHYYNNNYFKAPNERMAIIAADIKMQQIIQNDFIKNSLYFEEFNEENEDDLDFILNYGYILKGEFTNSPTLNYLKGLTKNNKNILLQDGDFYKYSLPVNERILSGLSLTRREYENFNEEKKLVKELIK